MTDHVPENLNDWPDDAWQLLGVDRGADLKSLRRAYTRLIRKFKPEHSPDKFQKIREAYDAVRKLAELKEQFELADDSAIRLVSPNAGETNAESAGQFDPANGSTSDRSSLADSRWVSTDSSTHDLDETWRLALDGDIAAARRGLEQLHTRMPDNEDVVARLYWIRKITPSDSTENLIEWLIGIVKRRGPRGRPWQFLLTESAWNSRETLRDDIIDLACTGPQTERLVPLLLIRWKRMSRVLSWKTIRNDLDLIRDQFLLDSPVLWVELLVSALQIVVWAETVPDDLLEELVNEISQFEELHLQHPQIFDQLEELVEIRQELQQAFQYRAFTLVSQSALSLIRAELLGRDTEADERLLDLAQQWQASPGAALTDLDRLAQKSPAIFIQLLHCVSRLNSSNVYFPEGQQAVMSRLVEQFVNNVNWQDPTSARLAIFDFCVREALSLRYVVNVVANSEIPALTVESIAQYFQGDTVLHCLCEGVTAANCQ